MRNTSQQEKATCSLKAHNPRALGVKGTKLTLMGLVFVVAVMFPHHDATAAAINLGSADGFAVLAGTGITIVGTVNSTTITGDIGSSPTASITEIGNLFLVGVNHFGDTTTQNAKTDLATAYGVAAGWAPTTKYASADTQLGGLTLTPGVYQVPASSFQITGDLYLDAQNTPDAFWIFQAGSTLTTASGSHVYLINGASAGNVYWQIGTSATLGTSTDFAGSILALTSITLNNGATVAGRILAQNGAVTFDHNTIVTPVPEAGMLQLFGIGMVTLVAFRRRFFPGRVTPHSKG